MFCHHCGAQIADGSPFCTACGQALAAPGAFPAPAPVSWRPSAGIRARPGRWIGAGWEMVKADIGGFVLLAIVFALLSSAVPIVLQGPLAIGFHIFCIKKLLNRRAELADLFKGFDYFVPSLVASLLISLFVTAGMILCVIPGLVVAAMYKFTYLFILDKRMDFWPAMQASHAVVKNDYFGFTMFLILIALVNLLGVICLFVGVFVTIPISIAAITVAYREIVGFEQSTLDALP